MQATCGPGGKAVAGTVFISHANEDKPRIVELIKALLDAGFSLFIDHPEKIESIDLDVIDGQTIRSLADIRNGQTTGYQDQLDAELRNADCVLGVLSEKITAENSVLLGEFDVARYEGKLILCSIARPGFKLPSRLASYNVNTLDRERHGNVIVERSLKLLIKQVRTLIDARQRNRQTGGQTAPPPTASDAYRVLHDLAPAAHRAQQSGRSAVTARGRLRGRGEAGLARWPAQRTAQPSA